MTAYSPFTLCPTPNNKWHRLQRSREQRQMVRDRFIACDYARPKVKWRFSKATRCRAQALEGRWASGWWASGWWASGWWASLLLLVVVAVFSFGGMAPVGQDAPYGSARSI
jgi:hypothetical protein